MAIVVGVALVLVTWAAVAALLAVIGSPIAALLAPDRADQVRMALWWGLGAVTTGLLAVSLAGGIASAAGAVVLALALVSGAIRWRMPRPAVGPLAATGPGRALVIGLGVAVAFLGLVALGPVTNYDTGLYHLGAIRYAAEFGTVPGLANLYEALGYSTSVFPLAAGLDGAGWGDAGFRLLGGLLATLVAIELTLRLLQRARTPGTWILVVGVAVTWMPLIAIGDFWIASPSSDTSVLLLSIVAVAYLADGVVERSGSPAQHLATAIVVAVMALAMRPTMLPFTVTLALVALAVGWRTRSASRLPVALAGSIAIALGVLQLARDAVLSGWLVYPLSLLPLDVPWRAPDPWQLRTATLGNARDPATTWASASGWDWIGPWLARAPSQWETWMLALLVVGATVFAWAAVRGRWVVDWRGAGLVAMPPAVAVVAWFVAAPPSYRFIWGPLFALPAVVLGFALAGVPRGSRARLLPAAACVAASFVLISVSAVTLAFRTDVAELSAFAPVGFGPVRIDVPVAPLPEPAVAPLELASGLVVSVPVDGEQCWAQYPLCTPRLVPTVRMLGPSIADGFGF